MEDYFSHIEAYLDGQLSGELLHAFEKELASNAMLQKEVNALKVLRNDLAWLSASKSVEGAQALRKQKHKKRQHQLRYLMATLGLILVGLLAYWAVPKIFTESKEQTSNFTQTTTSATCA